MNTPHAIAVGLLLTAATLPPLRTHAAPPAEVSGCVVGFADAFVEGVSLEELRVAITLELRKAGLADRVRLRQPSDGRRCGAAPEGAVRIQVWPQAVVELESGQQRQRLALDDMPPSQRADAVARAVVELVAPDAPELQLVPATLPGRVAAASSASRRVELQSNHRRDPGASAWDYRPAGSWISMGLAIDLESRSGLHARTGLDIAGAASLVHGRMDIGVWATFYPTTEVAPALEERGGDVVFFMGYNHLLPHHLEARFRLGAGFSYREVTHTTDALAENATLDPALRAEIELRWRFASFAHVGAIVGARMFAGGSNYRLQNGSVIDATAGSGLFGLRVGVDL